VLVALAVLLAEQRAGDDDQLSPGSAAVREPGEQRTLDAVEVGRRLAYTGMASVFAGEKTSGPWMK
jgi:hypothetical protein